LEKSFNWLRENIPSAAESVNLEEIFAVLSAPPALPEPHFDPARNEDLKQILEEVRSLDVLAWNEGWKSNSLAHRFQVELTRLRLVHDIWMKIHFELTKNRVPHENSMIENIELSKGIKPSLI
jgi:hypothetical protein